MHEYAGTCACGRVEVRLLTGRLPSEFQPRSDAPTCAFCNVHDGVWISDPNGTLRVRTADATRVRRFASDQVQFHFCCQCDGLAYAVFDDTSQRRSVAVARVAQFASIRTAAMPTLITNFEGETLEVGRQRRLEKWTPLERY